MTTPFYRAIQTAVTLVRTTGMALHDACRLSASEHGVDTVLLYRELTQ